MTQIEWRRVSIFVLRPRREDGFGDIQLHKIYTRRLRAYPIRAILLAILHTGSARNPHVLCVRFGFSALSVFKLPATITPTEIGAYFLCAYTYL
ncbi:hypothetical protein [Klebsiella quasipneumoniae]|uniref:hypothetical protein n=1 Tax=Klebsiella quasipneumoniae TaxID=1463165 RepID=UPI0019D16CE0|nr:hypothetical protein [Klebsiella quasipneumoniae]